MAAGNPRELVSKLALYSCIPQSSNRQSPWRSSCHLGSELCIGAAGQQREGIVRWGQGRLCGNVSAGGGLEVIVEGME